MAQEVVYPSSYAGGFIPSPALYNEQRADQGRDLMTNPGGAIVAPGAGVVIRNGVDPNGFGTSYPIVRFTSGPYAGKQIYVGHTLSVLKPGQQFNAGEVLGHTGTTGNEPWNGNASKPGWAEIGYAQGGVPGKFGQPTPFGSTPPQAQTVAKVTPKGSLSYGQLMGLWVQAGGKAKDAPLAAAIAMAESSGRINALNNNPKTGDYSVGPWQINYFGQLSGSRTKEFGNAATLRSDPLANARAAVSLFYGQGPSVAWNTTMSSGNYKQYLQPNAKVIYSSPSGGTGAAAGAGSASSQYGTYVPPPGPPVGTVLLKGDNSMISAYDPSNAPKVTPANTGGWSVDSSGNITPGPIPPANPKIGSSIGGDWLGSLVNQYAPPTLQEMHDNAASWANQQVAAQVAGYRSLMQYYADLGLAQQGAMQQAGKAAADVLTPYVQGMGNAYDTAAATSAAIAGGYGQQLQGQTAAQTAQSNADLAAANAPARVADQGGNIAAVATGINAQIPSQSLEAQGLAAQAAAGKLPNEALQYAVQQGYGAQAAQFNNAQQLVPQIVQAQASLPQLTQQYMMSQQQLASQQFQNMMQVAGLHKPIMVGSLRYGGVIAVDPVTGNILARYNPYGTSATASGASATPFTLTKGPNNTILRLNKATGETTVAYKGAAVPGKTYTSKNPDGTTTTFQIDAKTGQPTNVNTVGVAKTPTIVYKTNGLGQIVHFDAKGNEVIDDATKRPQSANKQVLYGVFPGLAGGKPIAYYIGANNTPIPFTSGSGSGYVIQSPKGGATAQTGPTSTAWKGPISQVDKALTAATTLKPSKRNFPPFYQGHPALITGTGPGTGKPAQYYPIQYIKGKQTATDYMTVFHQLLSYNPNDPAWTKYVISRINGSPAYKAEGASGRPYLNPTTGQQAAIFYAQKAQKLGWTPAETAQDLRAGGMLSDQWIQNAVAQVFPSYQGPVDPRIYAGTSLYDQNVQLLGG